MLSFQIYAQRRELGALNLLGRGPRTVNPDTEAIGALLATLATVALTTAERQRQFGVALASRDLIGQAEGILMDHFKIDADRAFGMLRTLSQDGNTPLRTLAQDVIDTL